MIAIEEVEKEVCAYYGLPNASIHNRSRFQANCTAKHMAWAVAFALGHSAKSIGRHFRVHHSSVLHGVSKAKKQYASDFQFIVSGFDTSFEFEPAKKQVESYETPLGGRRGYHYGVPCVVDSGPDSRGLLHIRVDGARWTVPQSEVVYREDASC